MRSCEGGDVRVWIMLLPPRIMLVAPRMVALRETLLPVSVSGRVSCESVKQLTDVCALFERLHGVERAHGGWSELGCGEQACKWKEDVGRVWMCRASS